MIARVVWFTLAGFALGGIGLAAASRRVDRAVRRERFVKLATYFAIVHGFLFTAWWGATPLSIVCGALAVVGASELVAALRRPRAAPAPAPASPPKLAPALAIAIAYAIVATGFVMFAARTPAATVIFVYLLVAAFDGFSQVFGQLAGRRALVPAISPMKTVEGLAGGLVAAAIAGWLLADLVGIDHRDAIVTAAFALPAAFAGDLATSAVKRRAGLKDFGRVFPGHGGVLDRFDSMMVAAFCLFILRCYTRPTVH